MPFDWSSLMFLVGNLVGAIIKRRPNSVAIFRDKLIPYWIFVAMLVGQFIAGVAITPQATTPSPGGAADTLSLAWFIPMFWVPFLGALKQTAIAVLLHQLTKQAKKTV